MKKTIIMAMGLTVASLCMGGEKIPLWPEGKIPDFQPNQYAAPSQESSNRNYIS